MDNTKIYGIIYDIKSISPIDGAIIEYSKLGIKTFSNSRGEYELLIPNKELELYSPISIDITKPNYQVITKKVTFDNVNLNVGLTEYVDGLSDELTLILSLQSQELDNLIDLNFEQFQQKKLTDLIDKLKTTLFPIILSLLIEFGISQISSPTPKTCPSPESIRRIVEKRNKLTRQLSITLKSLDVLLKSLGVIQGILIAVEIAEKAAALIPIPTPPIIPKTLSLLNEQIKKYKHLNTGLISLIFILRSTINNILEYLKILDNAIQECSQESDNLEQLNLDILNTVNETNISPESYESVNGFNFDIEIEPTPNPIKRKRAIALNDKGVVLLRGEYSYSSSNQILIDELIFYISSNNLKAD